MWSRSIGIVGVLLAGLVGLTPSAMAQQKKGFSLGVTPAVVEVVLEEPEEEKIIELTYHNYSPQALSLEIFPIDFKQQAGTGAVSFLGQEAGSYSYSLSSFLSFESSRLGLEPGEKRKFIISAKNRQDLSPGGHYAAVVARLVDDQESLEGTKIAPSISSLILLRKTGGERFNLSLTRVDWPQRTVVFGYPQFVTLLFQNEGNVHIVPYGRLEIRDFLGRLITKGVVNTSSLRVFPESRRYIKVEATKITSSLPLSFNTMVIKGQDSLKKTNYLYKETFVYVNPFLLVLLFGMVGLVLVRRRRKLGRT